MRVRRKMMGQDFARRWPYGVGPADGGYRGTRVLIEESDGAEAFAYGQLLSKNGYDVQWCPGPDDPIGGRCPLVTTGHCELVEQADVVVSALGIDQESCRHVLATIRRLHPQTPVVVQASRRESARWAHLVEGKSVLETPVCGPALLASVAGATRTSP
jgi:DNA-binding response OmpR family regulator